MDKKNFAIFIDLENTGGKVATLNSVIEKVKIKGDILIGKLYGYKEAYSDLKEVLLSNTFSVVPSLRYGANQKNNLDIQLVIDALDVAYTNELIDCFCIVSGDSDYTPLVGKLKTMGKYVLGISRSEVASNIFIKACNEFIFLESVTSRSELKISEDDDSYNDLNGLMDLLEKIISDQADEDGTMYVSELKKTLLRLKPDFSERAYGSNSFAKLLNTLKHRYRRLELFGDHNSLKVKITSKDKAKLGEISKANWKSVFRALLDKLKDNGFERVNPSIIKAELQKDHPGFDEHQIGFRKFSDLMKSLEKEGIIDIEFNEARTMLIKIK